jgi:hypothetical protein
LRDLELTITSKTIGAAVGGAIGGILAIILLLLGIMMLLRRRWRQRDRPLSEKGGLLKDVEYNHTPQPPLPPLPPPKEDYHDEPLLAVPTAPPPAAAVAPVTMAAVAAQTPQTWSTSRSPVSASANSPPHQRASYTLIPSSAPQGSSSDGNGEALFEDKKGNVIMQAPEESEVQSEQSHVGTLPNPHDDPSSGSTGTYFIRCL